MKKRCLDQKNPNYKNYGGRGITVCEEWQRSFEAFRDWALQNGYADNLSIDRIDNNKGYCPENCRWTTIAEQNKNKRNIPLISYNGKSLCLADWERETGISRKTIAKRLKCGWSIERALATPVNTRKSHKRK